MELTKKISSGSRAE